MLQREGGVAVHSMKVMDIFMLQLGGGVAVHCIP